MRHGRGSHTPPMGPRHLPTIAVGPSRGGDGMGMAPNSEVGGLRLVTSPEFPY
jgi:hypothetical protein